VPPGGWYDSGQKFGKDGTYQSTKPDGTPGPLFKGKPGDPVIVQRPQGGPVAAPATPGLEPEQQPQQSPQSSMEDYQAEQQAMAPV
jgi:hypothetical protein